MSESGRGGVLSFEEEQMREKLKKLDMYEEGMLKQEMVNILGVLEKSVIADETRYDSDNFNKTPEPTRQDNQQLSYSRALNSKPPDRSSTSPEFSGSQQRKNWSNEKSRESNEDGTFREQGKKSSIRENRDNQPANFNKTRQSTNENSNESIGNKQIAQKTNSQTRNNDAHRMNPFDPSATNDVPLKPHYRVTTKKDCSDVGTSVDIDEAVAQLSIHLKQIAETWHSRRRTSAGSSAWGKPIQVDTEENTGTLDEERLSDDDSKNANRSKIIVDTDKSRKRRTTVKTTINYATGEITDDESDDDYSRASCSKKKRSSKFGESSKKIRTSDDTIVNSGKSKNRDSDITDVVRNRDKTNDDRNSDDEFATTSVTKKIRRRSRSSDDDSSSNDLEMKKIAKKRKNVEIDDDEDDDDENDGARVYPSANNVKIVNEKIGKIGKTIEIGKSSSNVGKNVFSRKTKKSDGKRCSKESEDEPVFIDDSDEIIITDGDDDDDEEKHVNDVRRSKINFGKRCENAVSSTSSCYPRRIVPPNPRGRSSGISSKNPIFDYSRNVREKKISRKNKDLEIAKEMCESMGNEVTEVTEVLENFYGDKTNSSDVELAEIKPLRLSDRMKTQLNNLKSLKKKEERLELERAEAQRAREEEICQEKARRIREKLEEEKKAARVKELTAKAKAATEAHWNNFLNKRGKKSQTERTELNPEGPRQIGDATVVEENWGDRFSMELNDVEVANDDDRNDQGNSKNVPCPICGKKFSPRLIEDHAGSCEEYGAAEFHSPAVTIRPTGSSQRRGTSKLFECAVCSIFTTNDGIKYEDHVNKCVSRSRDAVLVGPNTVVKVPDSPISDFRKISEQTDSEINYREQFVPRTKSHVNQNRKRKRR